MYKTWWLTKDKYHDVKKKKYTKCESLCRNAFRLVQILFFIPLLAFVHQVFLLTLQQFSTFSFKLGPPTLALMPLHLYFENIFWSFFQMHFVLHSSHISDGKLELAIEIMAVATFPLAFLCSFLSSHTPNKQLLIVQPLQFYKYKSSHVVWL